MIDQAVRDSRCRPTRKGTRKFQPGVSTRLEVVKEEHQNTLAWITDPERGGFIWWCILAGFTIDEIDEVREELITECMFGLQAIELVEQEALTNAA